MYLNLIMSFEKILGQDKAINILREYIKQSRLQGGYLFSGAQGVGKKLVAKALAKALNCQEEGLDSCDKCASCIKIENNQHPDVHLIENCDCEIKIENIRQLQREINLRPYEAKFKVFIVDNAHTLTAEAANALLKILEEPPKSSLIILITDKPALLFKTVVSRCKIIKFLPFPRGYLEGILIKDYALDNDTAHFLAYFSEGRIGCALTLKDNDIIREKNNIIDTLALSPRINLNSLSVKDRASVHSYINILASWYRDIYLIKAGAPQEELINFDRKVELLKIVHRFSFPELNEIMRSLSDSALYLEQNINLKLLLYNLGAQICKE